MNRRTYLGSFAHIAALTLTLFLPQNDVQAQCPSCSNCIIGCQTYQDMPSPQTGELELGGCYEITSDWTALGDIILTANTVIRCVDATFSMDGHLIDGSGSSGTSSSPSGQSGRNLTIIITTDGENLILGDVDLSGGLSYGSTPAATDGGAGGDGGNLCLQAGGAESDITLGALVDVSGAAGANGGSGSSTILGGGDGGAGGDGGLVTVKAGALLLWVSTGQVIADGGNAGHGGCGFGAGSNGNGPGGDGGLPGSAGTVRLCAGTIDWTGYSTRPVVCCTGGNGGNGGEGGDAANANCSTGYIGGQGGPATAGAAGGSLFLSVSNASEIMVDFQATGGQGGEGGDGGDGAAADCCCDPEDCCELPGDCGCRTCGTPSANRDGRNGKDGGAGGTACVQLYPGQNCDDLTVAGSFSLDGGIGGAGGSGGSSSIHCNYLYASL